MLEFIQNVQLFTDPNCFSLFDSKQTPNFNHRTYGSCVVYFGIISDSKGILVCHILTICCLQKLGPIFKYLHYSSWKHIGAKCSVMTCAATVGFDLICISFLTNCLSSSPCMLRRGLCGGKWYIGICFGLRYLNGWLLTALINDDS